ARGLTAAERPSEVVAEIRMRLGVAGRAPGDAPGSKGSVSSPWRASNGLAHEDRHFTSGELTKLTGRREPIDDRPPQGGRFLAESLPRPDRLVLAIDMRRGVRVGPQVQAPGRMTIAAEVQGSDRVSVAVLEVG